MAGIEPINSAMSYTMAQPVAKAAEAQNATTEFKEGQPLETNAPQVDAKTGIVPGIIAAVAVGCPFDVAYSVGHYSKMFKVHVGLSVFNYIYKHKDVLDKLPGKEGRIDAFKAKGDFTVQAVDDAFAPLYEPFYDGNDYHTDSSSSRYIDGVHTPLLCISAKNDPISMPGCIPMKEIQSHPHVSLILSPGGAHLGYFRFASVKHSFDEDLAIEFFKYKLQEWGKKN